MAISAKLQKQLADLPNAAGVYIMRDKDGVVVYVGKATSLRQRGYVLISKKASSILPKRWPR